MQSRELLYCVLETNTGKVRHLNQIQWLKPPAGWHKLNTDGSVVNTNGLSGCGGLLRDCSGQWVVGFAKSISVSSSIAAELWVLREGLGLCLERGISAVEIELDATQQFPQFLALSFLMETYPVLLMIVGNCCYALIMQH